MSSVVRIALITIEFVLFIFIAAFLSYKKYKREERFIGSIICFSVYCIINVLVLLLSYQSNIFLSYPKIICIVIIMLLEIGIWLADYWQDTHTIIAVCCCLISIVSLLFLVGGYKCFEDVFNTNSTFSATINVTPIINDKNGIGIIYDKEGHIVGYIFEYNENNKKYHVDISQSEVSNAKIDIDDSLSKPYVIKNTKYTTIINNEKKKAEETTESYTYEIHVSSSQMIGFYKG